MLQLNKLSTHLSSFVAGSVRHFLIPVPKDSLLHYKPVDVEQKAMYVLLCVISPGYNLCTVQLIPKIEKLVSVKLDLSKLMKSLNSGCLQKLQMDDLIKTLMRTWSKGKQKCYSVCFDRRRMNPMVYVEPIGGVFHL